MAFEAIKQQISLPASVDLSASQFLFCVCNSSSQAAVQTTAGANALGVIDNTPPAGQPAAITVFGVQKVVAGAAVVAGATVSVDGSGRAITAASGTKALGKALSASTALGDFISVLLQCGPDVNLP